MPSPPPVIRRRGGRSPPLFESAPSLTRPDQTEGPSELPRRMARVALVGNPNTGKTTLFNALTRSRRFAANYPGATVDIACGTFRTPSKSLQIIDLPGTYSLAGVSPDEQVVSNLLFDRMPGHEPPDAILAIVDASNLRRNLYLLTQLRETGLPMVVALNMVDVAKGRGLEVDAEKLSQRLGAPVIPVVATNAKSLAPLGLGLERVLGQDPPVFAVEFPEAIEGGLRELAHPGVSGRSRAALLRVLLDQGGDAELAFLRTGGDAARLSAMRKRLSAAGVHDAAAEARARYRWIDDLLPTVQTRPAQRRTTWSDRVDAMLTHKLGGALFLLAVLYVVFQSIFYWAGPLMEAIESAFAWLGDLVAQTLPEGIVQSAIVDGVIGGVGGVLVFLPQIMILFAFLALLEDCGYMARAAFMMDRLMRGMGLSGRAFIPLLSSFACAVPAIMGTRAIADRRERFVTILIIPFMSCAARLPVYLVLIAALVPNYTYLGGFIRVPALVMLAMYLVGVVVALPIAWLLRKTAFAGPPPTFMLELPSYKLPRLRTVWLRVYFAAKDFLLRAGTIILLVNIIVWALAYFPRDPAVQASVGAQAAAENWSAEAYEAELAGAYLRDSYLGRMGRAIEPAIRPMEWDWRIGVSVLASFPAREVIVATLGTLFNLGEGADEGSVELRDAIAGATWEGSDRPLFTLPVALSIMVFFALCAQCASTLVIIGRETRSIIWPVISFVGMTTIAYFAAWGTASAARFIAALL